jgi:tetratricopeptide (TPR) repeat protein
LALGTQFLTAIGATSVALFERDRSNGQRLAEYLRKKGFVVQILDDAQTTIRFVHQGQISVVVLGFSEELEELPLCQALKEGDEPPAVIGLFERDLTHELNARLEPKSWPDQFFVRPVSFHQILHAIDEELVAREDRDEDGAPPPLLFPEVLAERWRRQETGVLRVTIEGLQTTIYIKAGVPVFAEQGSLGDTLGRVLLRSGKITPEQFAAAVDLITESLVDNEQQRLGEALVELGALTAKEVMEALRSQVQAKILACFRMQRFHSEFKPGEELLEGISTFRLSFGRLMVAGIKQEVSPDRLAAYLEPLAKRRPALALEPEVLQRGLGLTAQEQAFVQSIDGERPLRQLRDSSALDVIHASQLLTVLLLTGSLRFAAPTVATDPAAVAPAAPLELQVQVEVMLDPAAEERATPLEQEPRAESPAPQAATARLRDRALAMVLRLKGRSDWEGLRVAPGADSTSIEAAFSSRTAELRAIRADGRDAMDPELQRTLEEMEQELSSARARLLAGEGRATPGDPEQHKKRPTLLRAEKAFQVGLMQLEGGEEVMAAASFKAAASLRPEAHEYRMFQLWSVYRAANDKEARAIALRDLRNIATWVTRHDPESVKALRILGQLALDEKRYEEAERHLQAAARVAPDDAEVRDAQKQLEAQRPNPDKKGKPGKKKFRLF